MGMSPDIRAIFIKVTKIRYSVREHDVGMEFRAFQLFLLANASIYLHMKQESTEKLKVYGLYTHPALLSKVFVSRSEPANVCF